MGGASATYLILVAGAALVLVAVAWEEAWRRHGERKAQVANCAHDWGPTIPVVFDITGQRPAGHKRFCRHCPAQKNVFWNGQDYVPMSMRHKDRLYPDDPGYEDKHV